jgi:cytochrome c
MKKIVLLGTTLLASMFSGAALALDGAALYMEKTCVACHGKEAKKPLLAAYPKLAGQNAAYAEAQMKDIKNGVRTNGNSAAMQGVMHLVSDEEIAAIAQYLSKIK